jgi:hypothetical protein
MITLTIKKSDGSIYWTEYFNDIDSCNAWLEEEKTRPYWDESFTSVMVQPNPPTKDEISSRLLITVKAQRSVLLALCDWTQLSDSPLTNENRSEWSSYRQLLRDLPDSKGFDPSNVTWPEMPTKG